MQKFSVLLSVYKKEKPEYLQAALASIAGQTLPPDEIVIAEDGLLTKELYAVLDSFQKEQGEKVKRLPFAENRGLGLALRDGVQACSHEYIARMDTDDIALPERFARQMDYVAEHPGTALLGTWIKEFSEAPERPESVTRLPCTQEEIIKYARKRNPFRHMTVVFKKSAVIGSGNYRDFPYFEDYDLWVRLLQSGCQCANIPEYLVNVRADREMFARRGGWQYLKWELRFQRGLLRSGFISWQQFLANVMSRSIVRLLPNGVRKIIYERFLRSR